MPSGSHHHRHSVYGLTVETWVSFPELAPALADAAVDAVFRLGAVPAELPECRQRGARFQAAPGRLLAWLDGVARYLAIDGREILVQPAEGSAENELRMFLLCSPMGALLLQRGLLPLHSSAIATPSGAVVFMGHSAAGKSTLAACFRQRGFRVLADDISVVRFAPDGAAWVMPGLPQFKLWPDALSQLGANAAELSKLRSGLEKRALPFPEGFHPEPLPLAKIYLLQPHFGPETELDRLVGMDKLQRLLEHTYRGHFVPGLGLATSHFQAASRLAGAVPITRVRRGKDGIPDRLADRITADFSL